MVNILYKDEHIVVCEKEPGMLSQSDAKGDTGIPEELKTLLGVKEVFTVHRLDRPVGGLIVYALNGKAAARLSSDNDFKKIYLAAVSGCPAPENGEMFDYLYKDAQKNKSFVVKTERKGAKPAKLAYELIETMDTEKIGTVSLVRIELFTGRTHQIRVQFSSRGMPIAGDGKYGSRIKRNDIALWAHKISFTHPITLKRLEFVSEPKWKLSEI